MARNSHGIRPFVSYAASRLPQDPLLLTLVWRLPSFRTESVNCGPKQASTRAVLSGRGSMARPALDDGEWTAEEREACLAVREALVRDKGLTPQQVTWEASSSGKVYAQNWRSMIMLDIH